MFNRYVDFQLSEETKRAVLNPSRGWYEIYSFSINEEIDFDELIWSLRDNETLVLVIIDISGFKDKPLSDSSVVNFENILTFFGKAHKDIILRITYDRAGEAHNSEPALFSTVLLHMAQLGAVVGKYEKCIFTMQGMFVGNWGEMHGSDYLTESHIEKMYEVLYEATQGKIRLAVRKPVQWRYIFDSMSSDEQCMLGLFDDGMFGSETNLGTFGVAGTRKADRKQQWTVSDELDFIEKLCVNVPCGGEVIWSEYSDNLTAEDFVDRLCKMHVTYLNCVHDERLLDKWKKMQYENMSLYDYIGLHMGYSLKITDLKYRRFADKVIIYVKIKNEGFAALYDKSSLKLTLVTSEGETFSSEINIDNILNNDKEYTFKHELPLQSGKLYIQMKRQSDGAEIAFSNAFDINKDINIDCGAYIGSVTFQ